MRPLLVTSALLSLWVASIAQAQPSAAPETGRRATGRYLMIDGARIYYEKHGKGPPVVLLHGGLFGYLDEFADIIALLRPTRTVIAIALRGHGLSELGADPLSNRQIARDAAAIIRHETRDSVDLIGFSTGAVAAYHLIVEEPALVRSLVAVGGPLSTSGVTEAAMAEAKAYANPRALDSLYPAIVAKRRRLYPDRGDWDRLVRAFAAMPIAADIPDTTFRAISQPVMIVAGDRDHYTRTEHFVEVYRLLRRGSLALVPGCGHVVLACKPALMRGLIRTFLDRSPQSRIE